MTPPPPRRRDRAIPDDAWIRALLQRIPVGVLAAISDDEPYLHPTSFVYDQDTHAIYTHTAHSGRMPTRPPRSAALRYSYTAPLPKRSRLLLQCSFGHKPKRTTFVHPSCSVRA